MNSKHIMSALSAQTHETRIISENWAMRDMAVGAMWDLDFVEAKHTVMHPLGLHAECALHHPLDGVSPVNASIAFDQLSTCTVCM